MTTNELQDTVLYQRDNVYDTAFRDKQKEIFDFSEDYKAFLDSSKTERLSVQTAVKLAEKAGFSLLEEKTELKTGDKVYTLNRGKGIFLAVIGEESLNEGINLVAAHIDAPRLDLKPNPLYEDMSLALLKTHYYGGIKKYQWPTIPLALYGVVYLADGTKVEIAIGDKPQDPVFYITDLLPHLATEQMGKKLAQGITGESLNLLVGSIPYEDKEAKERVKLNVLKILNESYGICEKDFISAELEVVPAYPARDVGFDRSLISAYGHDDRVCSFTGLRAILDCQNPKKTAVCMLVDKEEIGSMGNTGMQSRFFEHILGEMCDKTGASLRLCMTHSTCLSADVGAANDPTYPTVQEKNNAAVLNGGIMLSKYTGSRGKSGSSDASAELVSKIRRLFDKNGIVWQIAELGKVDEGGGGTVAQFVANLDIDTIDCGVPLLSMHAPYEIAAKADVYMAYLAYKAFLEQ